MAAYIKNIIDKNGDIVYPRTKANAVYDENGNQIKTVIDGKANIADVYTRTEIDNLINIDTEGYFSNSQFVISTLVASKWNTSEKTYSFESDYPSSEYNMRLLLPNNCTNEESTAFYNANISGSTTNNILVAQGNIPTIDIPVILEIII